MTRQRVFTAGPLEDGEALSLGADDLHHLRDVARIRVGEEIVAVEPGGRQSVVEVTALESDAIFGRTIGVLDEQVLPRVVLVQGIAKNPKMDLIVQKATELGAERIVAFFAQRSVVRDQTGSSRSERWARIAKEAARQSQRQSVPEIVVCGDAGDAMREVSGIGLVVVLEDGAARGLGSVIREQRTTAGEGVAVVVGPEGGLTATELETLEGEGAIPVRLGETILRTETAAIAAVALAAYESGGLGGVAP